MYFLKRIAFAVPDLPESTAVELIVLPEATPAASRRCRDVLEFIDSLPDRQRTPEEWEALERELREERDAWDR